VTLNIRDFAEIPEAGEWEADWGHGIDFDKDRWAGGRFLDEL
jgi:hypothetical protein